jgi:hypothetical protein
MYRIFLSHQQDGRRIGLFRPASKVGVRRSRSESRQRVAPRRYHIGTAWEMPRCGAPICAREIVMRALPMNLGSDNHGFNANRHRSSTFTEGRFNGLAGAEFRCEWPQGVDGGPSFVVRKSAAVGGKPTSIQVGCAKSRICDRAKIPLRNVSFDAGGSGRGVIEPITQTAQNECYVKAPIIADRGLCWYASGRIGSAVRMAY